MIELSQDQEVAINTLVEWYTLHKNDIPFFTLGGYAGTGKTTCIVEFRKKVSKSSPVAFCAYTGKAANVLRKKIKENSILNFDFIGTIHKLIYEPDLDENKKIIGWKKRPDMPYSLIIVDESSMITEEIFQDLKYYNVPILFVGDHGQLPPIGDAFNLMSDPFLKLEKLHRFAENNALIRVATMARMDGYIPFEEFSPTVKKLRVDNKVFDEQIIKFCDESNILSGNSVVIAAYNKSRISINQTIRSHYNFTGQGLLKGERVICLKNNYRHAYSIFNGMQGTVEYARLSKGKVYLCELYMDGESDKLDTIVSADAFNNEGFNPFLQKQWFVKGKPIDYFDFGYCLTCHKSQGSEYEHVMVVEQKCGLWEHNKWLYTAVTRSSKNLTILSVR